MSQTFGSPALTRASKGLGMDLTGDEDVGWYLPNCKTNLVIVHNALPLVFWHFVNTTAYHLCRYEPSSSPTKELHGLGMLHEQI